MSTDVKKHDLTICTVSFKQKYLIEANIELQKKLNPNCEVEWIITENTPKGVSGGFDIGRQKNITVLRGKPNNFSGIAPASYHHASGMNMAIKEVQTRYLLILDPDFYIVRKNWLSDVLSHMNKNELSFFGVPYNPKRYLKYRYFPCIHCVFIDLHKINKNDIDINPSYDQKTLLKGRAIAQSKNDMRAKNAIADIYYNCFIKIKRFVKLQVKRGAIIGCSRDTGYTLYSTFNTKKKLKVECAQPVFKIDKSEVKPNYLKSWWNRFIELFLPESLCYLPKKANFYTKIGFKELGYPDVFSENWDEFVWKNAPFGFHMQGGQKDGTVRDRTGDIPRLLEIFDEFRRKN